MTIAVIKTGGKQYKVSENSKLKVEKLLAEVGQEVSFDEVLLTAQDDESDIKIGAPVLSGVKVTAKVLQQDRAKKVRVVKYKSKVRYKKVYGHRQPFTAVEITSIK